MDDGMQEKSHQSDETAIRKLVETWMAASKAGDIATVLDLMTEDVIFMVPGREPFGKEAFAGALYLVWLAWQAIRPGGRSPFQVTTLPQDSPRKLFTMAL